MNMLVIRCSQCKTALIVAEFMHTSKHSSTVLKSLWIHPKLDIEPTLVMYRLDLLLDILEGQKCPVCGKRLEKPRRIHIPPYIVALDNYVQSLNEA